MTNNGIPIMDDKMQRTNADIIRAMTDEELADKMLDSMRGWCPSQTIHCTAECKKCLLNWLQREAT